MEDWSKSKLIKKDLLRRHWGTPEAARLITLFSSMAAQKQAAAEHKPVLSAWLERNEGKPREVRAAITLAEKTGERISPTPRFPN